MADTARGSDTATGSTAPGSTASGSTAPSGTPPVALWLWAHTLGRFGIAAVLIAILWAAGIGIWAAALFGLLLSMPIAYVVLRPLRERLAAAFESRRSVRAVAKQDLRARLQGDETD